MMEKIQKFNLEIALFGSELYSYAENVNEINDETMKLLTETILGINKLQINSKFRETSTIHESGFVNNLNNDVFKCRRFIVCCLCHEQIPLCLEDYNIHIQKKNHKDKEIEYQSQRQNGFGNHLVRTTSMVLVNDNKTVIQSTNIRSDSSDNSSVHNGNTDRSRASSVDISPRPSSISELGNLIDFEAACMAITRNINNECIFRTAQRTAFETKIINNLSHYLKAFDSTLQLKIFGSTTYGFGGSKMNFNILVNTGESDQEAIVALYSFQKFLKASDAQSDFKISSSISGDRVQKRRIPVIHNASGILCLIQFDSNFKLAESSQSIRDCILHEPMCYHLIAYIRHWQKAINEMLVQNGLRAIEFNTYIISVLVIFFLQLNQNFPKLSNVPPSQSNFIHRIPPCHVEKEKLRQTIGQFFKFYGDNFQVKRQIISVNIGRWQERFLQSQQTNFTLEQRRLRDGIKESYFNWDNCAIYVQDPNSPGTNITAEILEEEANNFQQMCKMFASHDSYGQSIDTYWMQLTKVQSEETNRSTSIYEFSKTSSNTLEFLNDTITKMKNSSASSSISDLSRASIISTSSNSATTQKLKNVVDIKQVSRTIPSKTVDLINRIVGRCFHEIEIVALLTRYLRTFDSTLKVLPFGSATYGFGGSTANFNILVNAGDQKPYTVFQSFEKVFKTPGAQNDFKILPSISGSRVQNRRLPVIHNASGILCWIQFDSNFELAKSSLIIRNYIMHDPICYHLIAYVRAWQNSLNENAAQNGMHAFHFNTYIISILVIFFLQLNHEFPKLADLPSSEVKSIDFIPNVDKGKFKTLARQFFEFYGKYYEINCKVISVDVGRWQNRELDGNQTNFTPAQKRLREGIEINASSWGNCSMYLQDLKSGTNATAEISKQEANNFKEMCREFAATTLHEQIIDEYLLKLSQARIRPDSSKFSLNDVCPRPMKKSNYELSEASLNSLQRFKNAFASSEKPEEEACSSSSSNISANTNASAHSTSNSMKRLEDAIKIDGILKSTVNEMNLILTRTNNRIQSEQEIIRLLSFLLTTYDSTLTVVPFGSATYGFGGKRTNFNILIITGGPSTTHVLQTSFENLLKTTGLQQDFEFLCHVRANRVQSEHIKISHKKYGIVCVIQFTKKGNYISSEKENLYYLKQSQIIRDYMNLHPMCKPLIGYVKAWQCVLNEVASDSGLVAFNMNSYIIAALVIFYLQLNHGLPTITELPSAIAKGMKFSTKNSLRYFVEEFFIFYGKTFESKTHLISLNVGRWQQKQQGEQKHFTSAQKSLRDGIRACPKNWEACPMCVQDIVSLSTNITAEITKSEMDNFKRMCQMFSKHVPKFDDKCLSSKVRPIIVIGQRTLNANHNTDLIEFIEKEIMNSRVPAVLETRQRAELEIIATLTKYLRDLKPSLKLYPFGSTQYGIKFACTNFNILIVDEATPGTTNDICELFYLKCKIWNSGLAYDQFKEICQIKADRAMDEQITMIHVKSGIKCLILFQNNNKITQSTDIIKRFATDPLCNFLITFVRMWQVVLNQLNIARFEFNTYTISILVIFFLQMNHQFPTIDQTSANICSTVSNFKPILKGFFAFYGNRYQIWNHVISTEIGQWQQRPLQREQTSFTPAQKRSRTGIEESPENWKNCTMYVQDLIRPDVNVTAEITKGAAEKFQEMCQVFAEKLK